MSTAELLRPDFESGSTQALPLSTLVIFGATGDLAQRKLLPALYNLAHEGLLPPRLNLVGTARTELTDGDYRRLVAEWVRRHSRRPPVEAVLADLLGRVHFLQGRFDDPALHANMARRLHELDHGCHRPANRLFYLSTAPELFSPIVAGLGAEGLQRCAGAEVRVLIEKPFGRSAAEAADFNRTLLSVFTERQVFRIDHYLGKEEVQNILALRFANAVFEPLWSSSSIASVQLTAAEDLGVGRRAGYYEGSGALRDHIQNHMLQLLSMICMEPPADLSADALRDEKVRVLSAVSVPGETATVRGQYGAGEISGEPVRGYLEEDGVGASSRTETFAALRLEVGTPRWAGVPFYLRTGKRLAGKRTEIAIRLRPKPHAAFVGDAEFDPFEHHLVIGLQARGSVRISFATKVPGAGMKIRPVTVELPAAGADPAGDPYERLLRDGIDGDATLFTRSDEIEQQWRICDPVLRRWAQDGAPALYPSGSQGPVEAQRILREGDAWRAI
jgi:glucose-6-phosphate 1-dehydrogenase